MQQTKPAKHIAMLLGGVVALAATQAMVAHAHAGPFPPIDHMDGRLTCSFASLRGAFGFTATGMVNGLGSVVRVGREVFDGKGHASGTATTSVNGSILQSTFTATYTVNPDCTGTMTEVDSAIGTAHDNIVLVNGGQRLQAMGVDPGETVEAHWEKQSRD